MRRRGRVSTSLLLRVLNPLEWNLASSSGSGADVFSKFLIQQVRKYSTSCDVILGQLGLLCKACSQRGVGELASVAKALKALCVHTPPGTPRRRTVLYMEDQEQEAANEGHRNSV